MLWNYPMLEDVLRNQCRLDPDSPVLAGISGGPDSLCLLNVMLTAGYRVVVANFNHKLRPEADLETEAVAEHAKHLGLPFITDSADVRRWAREQALSIEEAARTLRYRFLFAAARQERTQAVAVGHTADDQVETILMHFLRGAGLAGLKGMESRVFLPVFDSDIPLVRPLLSLWRTDTEEFCRDHGLAPHIDASNTDKTYFRNRLRHTLIPELEKYNPRFKKALVRTALALQGDYAALQADLNAKWEQIVVATGDGWVAFDLQLLVAYEPGLRRNLFRQAGELLRPESRDIGFEALERAAAFVGNEVRKQTDFVNGLYITAENGRIYLAAYESDLPFGNWPMVDKEWTMETGQQLTIGNGWVLTSNEYPPDPGNWSQNTDPWTAWLDAQRIGHSLLIRSRHEGDIFHPLGMRGQTVKVREFFINEKISKRARDKWPLICAGNQIAWIPGYRISHTFRVTEETQLVLKLTMRKL
jgi:tRNA(Ile)-lysidine synthase